MRARDFCFWLQGYFELNRTSTEPMTAEQEDMIKTHLSLVFKHDPEFTGMEHLAPGHHVGLTNGNPDNLGKPRRLNTGETLLC